MTVLDITASVPSWLLGCRTADAPCRDTQSRCGRSQSLRGHVSHQTTPAGLSRLISGILLASRRRDSTCHRAPISSMLNPSKTRPHRNSTSLPHPECVSPVAVAQHIKCPGETAKTGTCSLSPQNYPALISAPTLRTTFSICTNQYLFRLPVPEMRFATPVSRQLHASAASLGSLAAASQAQSLPNLKSYFTPSTPFPQLLASSHEPLHAQGLPFVKGGGPSLGSHTWPSCQVRLQPDLGLLRFLNDKDDSSHAYTNGLTTQADRQHVLAALSEKFETSLTIANTPSPYDPLASETPDEHPNECTKTTLPPLHCGEQPVHRSSLAAQSMCGSTSSIASSHSSLTSVRVFSEKSECTSMQSSLATIFSQAHEQDEVIVLATLGDKSNEDRNLGQEDNLAAEPHIPKDHFGDEFECSFALEEEAFEDWIDHIIQYHLVHGTVQQISCPYCPEQLLEGAEISHDRAVIKQRLEHLRTHSPWLESRCAWPVYVQYAQTCPSGDTSATSRPATSARIDDCPKLPHDDGEQSSHRQRVSNRIKHAKDEGLDQDCSKTSAQPNHASPIASQQANGVRHHGLGSGKGSGGHPPASAPSDEAALPPQPNGGRRRQGLSRDDAGDDGDDERSQHPRDNDKPMHHGTVRVTRREVALKYACPFFKHDDQRFMDCAYTAVQDFQGIKSVVLPMFAHFREASLTS